MQFLEDLTDRQAAEAVRSRIDWKYFLGLELTDSGFDYSVLSEFRMRLVLGDSEQRLLDSLLDKCKRQGWLKKRGKQQTDSTHVVASTRTLNRLETVGETLRAALNVIATDSPNWLKAWLTLDWFDRYSHAVEEYPSFITLSRGKVSLAMKLVNERAEKMLHPGFELSKFRFQGIEGKDLQPTLQKIPAD